MYFSEQGWVHAITFFHTDAMHLGGIFLECQWWLFFPFAPIFCDGWNYSAPWHISIGSICGEQECSKQNKQKESPVVAKNNMIPLAGFKFWPLQFQPCSSTCCCLILTFCILKKLAQATCLCWSADNIMGGYTESDNSFSGNSFRFISVHVCCSQTSIETSSLRWTWYRMLD